MTLLHAEKKIIDMFCYRSNVIRTQMNLFLKMDLHYRGEEHGNSCRVYEYLIYFIQLLILLT